MIHAGLGAIGGPLAGAAAVPGGSAASAPGAPAPMAARGNAAVEKGGRKKDPFADLLG